MNGAVKLDNGKRKLSLIHPSIMPIILTEQQDKKAIIRSAIIDLSYAAHSYGIMEIKKWVDSAIGRLVDYDEKEVVNELARAMEYGEAKPEYGRNNWKKGMAWSRLIDAAMRHGLAILYGEEIDNDSGNTHYAHMLGSIHMLLGNMALGVGTNDIFVDNDKIDAKR